MHKPAALILVATLTALALAACGGGGSNTNATTTGTTVSSGPAARATASTGGAGPARRTASHAAALKFSQCMRANGVPSFPDPSSTAGGIQISAAKTAGSGSSLTVNGVSVNAPAFRAAMQKCQKELPNPPPLSAAQVAKVKASAIAFAKCMRAHGVPNFPDPQITTGPGGHGIGVRMGFGQGSGVDPHSPAFQAASQKCGGKRGFAIRIAGPVGGA